MTYARPSDKNLRRLLRDLERAGCKITGGGQRHYKVRCTDGETTIIVPATPRGERYLKNTITKARQAGTDI